MKWTWVVLVGFCFACFLCPAQQVYRFDSEKSHIHIHLDISGALRFAGHAHLIQTPIQEGEFIYDSERPTKSSVELTVNASALKVMDPDLPAKDKEKVQATMESDHVLDVKRYPKITFKSLKVEPQSPNGLKVTGNLTIRDQTHPVVVEVTVQKAGSALKATGETKFKQTTFGIKPPTAGLGTVRVRDEMSLSFEITAEPKSGRGS